MRSLRHKVSAAFLKARGSLKASYEVRGKFFHVESEDSKIIETYCRDAELAAQRLEEIRHFSWDYQVGFCIEMLMRVSGEPSAREKGVCEVYMNQ